MLKFIALMLAILASTNVIGADLNDKDDRVKMWLSFSAIAAGDPAMVSNMLSFNALYLDRCDKEFMNPVEIHKHPEFPVFQFVMMNPDWDGKQGMFERLCKT